MENNMSIYSASERKESFLGFLKIGVLAGMAGGFAEIAIVALYSAVTGGNAATVAREVATAAGLDNSSVVDGLVVHMGLAVALGVGLSAVMRVLGRRLHKDGAVFTFMAGALAMIWAINFFVVLPVVSPAFVHLLPYAVTLASKLAFGAAAAVVLNMLKTGSTHAGDVSFVGAAQ
jgi:hypothetical protein